MTLQEMFDAAFIGLASQEFKKCKTDEGFAPCVLRGPNGLKCAAGWLIPDEDWDEESNATPADFHPYFTNKERFSESELKFIVKLQKAHDNSAGAKSMRNLMILVADEYKLTVPTIEETE